MDNVKLRKKNTGTEETDEKDDDSLCSSKEIKKRVKGQFTYVRIKNRRNPTRAVKLTMSVKLTVIAYICNIFAALENVTFILGAIIKILQQRWLNKINLPSNALIRIIIVANTMALRCTRVNFMRECGFFCRTVRLLTERRVAARIVLF